MNETVVQIWMLKFLKFCNSILQNKCCTANNYNHNKKIIVGKPKILLEFAKKKKWNIKIV